MIVIGQVLDETPLVRALRVGVPVRVIIFVPLVFLVFWMGIYPAPFLDVMSVSVDNLITNFNVALENSSVHLASH